MGIASHHLSSAHLLPISTLPNPLTMLTSPLNALRTKAAVAGSLLRGPAATQKRFLSIHEHLSMGLVSTDRR